MNLINLPATEIVTVVVALVCQWEAAAIIVRAQTAIRRQSITLSRRKEILKSGSGMVTTLCERRVTILQTAVVEELVVQ